MEPDARPSKRARPTLVRKAEELMRREHLFPSACRALVMVSGGQDSLALLHLLAGPLVRGVGPASLHALHINHHLRGAESDSDEALVVAACASLGMGLTVLHRPIDKRPGNVQEVAREARRQAAIEAAADAGCDRIALGHTADDQVETLLYRLGRYGGLAALTGMRPADPPWVRPLLDCRRVETAAYCAAHGLEFAVDRGNAYPGYARTSIREKVLPAWEAALPGAVEAACRAAEVAAEMRELAVEVLSGSGAASAQGLWGMADAEELSIAVLLGLSPPLRRLLLHAWLEARARPAASRASVLAVEALLVVGGSAERSLAGGLRACKEYDRLFLDRAPRRLGAGPPAGAQAPAWATSVPLPLPGRAQWGGVTVTAEPAERFQAPDVCSEAYVDAGSITGALEVRGPRPGDRFRPFGSSGSRKLQDILVDLRVPAAARAGLPLVVCGEHILWVCGLVMAEDGRITRGTKSLVRFGIAAGAER
jgi:tRNA(Ile)-lysidine synthase